MTSFDARLGDLEGFVPLFDGNRTMLNNVDLAPCGLCGLVPSGFMPLHCRRSGWAPKSAIRMNRVAEEDYWVVHVCVPCLLKFKTKYRDFLVARELIDDEWV